MPVAGGGFDQCYNAQAVVATDSLLVVASNVVQAPNDKQQLEPMLDKLKGLPEDLGQPDTLLADSGYFSEDNVATCEAAGIEPMIATGRQPHHPSLDERFADAPPAPARQSWPTACGRPKAKGSTACASRPRNQSSASSSPCWDSVNSCCAAWTTSRASGAW